MPSNVILNLKERYKNGYDNIGKDLIGACLSECKLYRRGTAYFSSSALMSWSAAMDHVINDKVKIEIICSPVISDRHLVEILKGSITPELLRLERDDGGLIAERKHANALLDKLMQLRKSQFLLWAATPKEPSMHSFRPPKEIGFQGE